MNLYTTFQHATSHTTDTSADIQFRLLFSAAENHIFNKRHISHLLLFDIPQQFLLIFQQIHTIVNKMSLNRKPSINQDFFAKLGKNLKQTMIC